MTTETELDDLNERVYRAQGYEKLPPPAAPQWQKPGSFLFLPQDYAGEIQAAWRLFEEMRQDSKNTYVFSAVDSGRVMPGKEFYVELSTGISAYGSTMPEAITRAYLAWKEER